MEDYAAKMAPKPDTALREYVTGHAQYREEAVLAALNELRSRGQPAPEDADLRPALEAVVQEQAIAAASTQAVAAAEVAAADLPQLYPPVGIVVVSVCVSVVVGAVMMAINLYRLKRTNAIIGLAGFIIAYITGRVLLLKWLVAQHLFSPWVMPLIDLPIIIGYVWWFWSRSVRTAQFQPRSWAAPLLVFVLVIFVFLLLNPGAAQQFKQQLELQSHQ